MPAKSESQRRLMGMVHAFKQGKLKNAPAKIKKVSTSISDEDARDFAKSVEDEEMSSGAKKAYALGKQHGVKGVAVINAEKSFGVFANYYHKGYAEGKQEKADTDAWHEKQQSGRRRNYHESVNQTFKQFLENYGQDGES